MARFKILIKYSVAEYMHIFIPNLFELILNNNQSKYFDYLYEILFKYYDSGNSIKLHIPKREIKNGESIYIDYNIPSVYDYDDLLVHIRETSNALVIQLPINKLDEDKKGNKIIDDLSVGDYEISLEVKKFDSAINSNTVKLKVEDASIEMNILDRNKDEMILSSIKSGGRYFNFEDTKEQLDFISKISSELKTSKNEINIHSFHKYWFILLFTLIIEWFYRKRKGLL